MTHLFSKMKQLLNVLTVCVIMTCSQTIYSQTFSLTDKTVEVNDSLSRVVFFTFDKVQIMDESKPFLDSLYTFLTNNSSIKIEIANHVDDRGDPEFNLMLSRRRAEMIADYLMNKGIQKYRLVSIGYGEYRPIIPIDEIKRMTDQEEKEKAFRINRRTVFRIVSID